MLTPKKPLQSINMSYLLYCLLLSNNDNILYQTKKWLVKLQNKKVSIYDIADEYDIKEYTLKDVEQNPKKFGRGITSRLKAFKFYEKIRF